MARGVLEVKLLNPAQAEAPSSTIAPCLGSTSGPQLQHPLTHSVSMATQEEGSLKTMLHKRQKHGRESVCLPNQPLPGCSSTAGLLTL